MRRLWHWTKRIVRKLGRRFRHPYHAPTGRLFRGPTPKKVFQTIDIGAGRAEFLNQRAISRKKGEKYRKRDYLAVDPSMDPNPIAPNVHIRREKIVDVLHDLIEKGEKTRHINWDMPSHTLTDYEPGKMFDQIKKVLLPGGRIFFTSEDESITDAVARIARMKGFIVRPGPPLMPYIYTRGPRKGEKNSPNRYTGTMEIFAGIFDKPPPGLTQQPILRLTIQYPTKKRKLANEGKN